MKTLGGFVLKEGWRYIGCAAAAALLAVLLDLELFALAAALGVFLLVWIYHQPDRVPSAWGGGRVVAPCDGKITAISTETSGRIVVDIDTGCLQTSLLYFPVEGELQTPKLIRGAMLSRKSPLFRKLNETAELCFEAKAGDEVRVTHRLLPGFAPLVIDSFAPRASTFPGGRYGVMVRGTTRLSLPPSMRLSVKTGERIFGGASLLGQIAQR